MAPQVGLEPTTDRLTADSSTTELLWINKMLGNVLLSRNVSPTTIGAKELNFCVRHGNRCDLFAIVTKQFFYIVTNVRIRLHHYVITQLFTLSKRLRSFLRFIDFKRFHFVKYGMCQTSYRTFHFVK